VLLLKKIAKKHVSGYNVDLLFSDLLSIMTAFMLFGIVVINHRFRHNLITFAGGSFWLR